MELDVAQQAVVKHGTGPALVSGCPGSGKTRTLEGRIAQLLAWKVPPECILVVTFTRTAAAEMKARMGNSGVEVRTFHSLALKLGNRLGIFNGLKMDERNAMYYQRRRAIQTLKRTGTLPRGSVIDAGAVDIFIAKCKAVGYVPVEGNIFGRNAEGEENVLQVAEGLIDEGIAGLPYDAFGCLQLYREIEQRRSAIGVYDYDTMQNWLWQALACSEAWLRWFQSLYVSILVDEGQDCSTIQHDIALLGTGIGSRIDPNVSDWDKRTHSLMVASDGSQALYSWRSADPQNLLEFSKDDRVQVYLLPFNYRSRPDICDLGTQLVNGKPWHLVGEIQPTRDGEANIEFKVFDTRQNEIRWAVDRAKADIGNVAIISRTSAILHYAELLCIREEIPYEKRGGQFLLDSREAKDLIAYVQIAAGLDDNDCSAMRRAVNAPFRYVARKHIDYCQARRGPNQGLLDALLGYSELKYPTKRGLLILKDLLADLQALSPAGPKRVIEKVVERTKYLDWLAEEIGMSSDEGDVASMMVDEVADVAAGFDDCSEFLAFVEGMRASKRDQQGVTGDGTPRVVISTVHGCKGEEYDEVILCDMVEGRFPSKQSTKSIDKLDEELRILYVAVTRAKDSLFLTRSNLSRPSRFLDTLRQVRSARNDS